MLYEHIYAHYEEMKELNEMTDESLMLDIDVIEKEQEKREQEFLRQLLEPYLDKHLDSVVLGCTHYPFARKMIQRIVGDSVTIFDGGEGTAREMKRRLAAADLLNPSEERGWVRFENSVSTEEELALCRRLLQQEI